jgi:hypothetical protein
MVKEYSYEKDKNLLLTPNFKVGEFRARRGQMLDGDKILIDDELVEKLELLSLCVHRVPVIITDGYRTEEFDRILTGGVGQHTKGKAADIRVKGYSSQELAALAEEIGFDGIGIINGEAIHVDTRGYKSFFIENSTQKADTTKVIHFKSADFRKKLVQKYFTLGDNTVEYLSNWNWGETLFEKLFKGILDAGR